MEKELQLRIIEKAASSGNYVRISLLFLVLSVLIGCVAVWGSFENSWLDSRISAHQDLFDSWDNLEMINNYVDSLKDLTPSERLNRINIKRLEHTESLSPEQKRSFNYACGYFDDGGYHNKAEVLDVIQTMKKARLNQFWLIQIPVIGSIFHINDLSLFFGLAISIALGWVTYSYGLKYDMISDAIVVINNLKSIDDSRNSSYLASLLISTNQIIDRSNRSALSSVFRFRNIVNTLLRLPVVVYIVIVLHDAITINNGLMQNFTMTVVLFVYSVVFFILIFMLTIICQKNRSAVRRLLTDNLPLVRIEKETNNLKQT